MHFRDLTALDLLFNRCSCGHTQIHGFYQQIDWAIDRDRLLARSEVECSKCGRKWHRTERLTKSNKKRRRLVDWLGLFWPLSHWIPGRLYRPLVITLFKLQRYVRI